MSAGAPAEARGDIRFLPGGQANIQMLQFYDKLWRLQLTMSLQCDKCHMLAHQQGAAARLAPPPAPRDNPAGASTPKPATRIGARSARPIPRREAIMSVARVTKLTASSPKSFQDAVQVALGRAAKTLRGITGLEVLSQKAKVTNGKIAEYRVTMEVTFILD
jgi:dodecin